MTVGQTAVVDSQLELGAVSEMIEVRADAAAGINYTMFVGNGRPLRATIKMGFKQARKLKVVQP